MYGKSVDIGGRRHLKRKKKATHSKHDDEAKRRQHTARTIAQEKRKKNKQLDDYIPQQPNQKPKEKRQEGECGTRSAQKLKKKKSKTTQ